MDNTARRSIRQRLAQTFSRVSRRQYLIGASVAGALLVLFVVGLLMFLGKRDALLASALQRAQAKLEHEYGLDLAVGRAYFSGLNKVNMERVALVPKEREALLGLDRASVSVRVLPLLTGTIKLGAVEASDIDVTLLKQDSISNYDFLFRERAADSAQTAVAQTAPQDMSASANALLNRVLRMI